MSAKILLYSLALMVLGEFSTVKAESLQKFRIHKGNGEYNQPITYQNQKAISYPDFSLQPIGSRYVPLTVSGSGPRCCNFHDFRLQKGSHAKTISWSEMNAGSKPLVFRFLGETYVLFKQSAGDFKLSEDEIVIQKLE